MPSIEVLTANINTDSFQCAFGHGRNQYFIGGIL